MSCVPLAVFEGGGWDLNPHPQTAGPGKKRLFCFSDSVVHSILLLNLLGDVLGRRSQVPQTIKPKHSFLQVEKVHVNASLFGEKIPESKQVRTAYSLGSGSHR